MRHKYFFFSVLQSRTGVRSGVRLTGVRWAGGQVSARPCSGRSRIEPSQGELMKKQERRREKIVPVQEKMLESVKGGSGYAMGSGDTGDPNVPTGGG
jgi:hypothetical protein